MIYSKIAKHLYSAAFSNADEEAAFKRLIAEETRRFVAKAKTEIASMILWYLHTEYGFGKDRLKKFYEGMDREYYDMLCRYELFQEKDTELKNIKTSAWLATQKLKEYGVDLNEWDGEGEIEIEDNGGEAE